MSQYVLWVVGGERAEVTIHNVYGYDTTSGKMECLWVSCSVFCFVHENQRPGETHPAGRSAISFCRWLCNPQAHGLTLGPSSVPLQLYHNQKRSQVLSCEWISLRVFGNDLNLMVSTFRDKVGYQAQIGVRQS